MTPVIEDPAVKFVNMDAAKSRSHKITMSNLCAYLTKTLMLRLPGTFPSPSPGKAYMSYWLSEGPLRVDIGAALVI